MQRTGPVLERGNERGMGDFRLGKAWSMDFPVYSAVGSSFVLRSSCGEQILERLPSARTVRGTCVERGVLDFTGFVYFVL